MTNKWDAKFLKATEPGPVARVLLENSHLLPSEGSALDVASGLGANTLHLAAHGLTTTAWDSSKEGLNKTLYFAEKNELAITTECIDLENEEELTGSFDVIVVCHYLYRPLCKKLERLLKPDGLLFYQTFTKQKSIQEGPTNPTFLLEKNELLNLFPNLSPVIYREERDCGDLTEGFRNLAYLIARKD